MQNAGDDTPDVFGIGGMAGGRDWAPMQLGARAPVPSFAEQLAATHTTVRVALIGCGKTKLDHAAPAKDLYTGNLFAAARAHVEAGGYDAWFVLSAKHGLVHPDTVIEPYDEKMPTTKAPRERWATKVSWDLGGQFGEHVRSGGNVSLDVFAGKDYADFLGMGFSHVVRPAYTFNKPLAGLQIGERLAWFAEHRAIPA